MSTAAAKAPNQVALSCGEETLTYAEFDSQARRLACGMQSAGIGKGDRVALHMGNTIELALSYFACFKLGAIAVPINIRLKPREIEHVLGHSEASMYIGEPGLYERSASTPRCCPRDRFYDTGTYRRTEEYAPFATLLDASTDRTLPEVLGSDPGAILYTSGTTARPKGVTHSHDTLRRCAESTIAVGFDTQDVFLLYSPMTHASGLLCNLLPAVLLGTEAALVSRFEPKVVLQTIERRRCSAALALPASLQALCRELSQSPFDVSSIRKCLAGGDTVSVALQNEFRDKFGVQIQEAIGMTEAVPTCANKPGRIRVGSVGEPVEGVEVRIVDDNGNTVEPGAIGEMIVRTSGTMIGYWNDPDATALAVRDGWLYTGDLAYQDEDGYFWFAGRKKEIIIRGGSNISPQEVEEVLLQHPAVFQAGVVGMPDPELGESVIAFVSLRDQRTCSETELIDFAKRSLSDHKVPATVYFLAAIPLGNTGKVSRKQLKEILQQNACSTAKNEIPSGSSRRITIAAAGTESVGA